MAGSHPYNAASVRAGIRAFLEGHAVAGLIGVAVTVAVLSTVVVGAAVHE